MKRTVFSCLLALLLIEGDAKVLPQVHNTVRKTFDVTDVTSIFEYLASLVHEVDEVKGQLVEARSEVKSVKKQTGDILDLLRHWDRAILEEEEGEEPANALSSASTSPHHRSASPFTRRAPCPASFTVWRKRSCYALVGERATWKDARAACRDEHPDAHLVAVESEGEQRFLLQQLANEKGGVRHCDVWTSGTDGGTEGDWRWESSGKPIKYTYWQRNEPNNGGGDEHCLWMDWYFNWKWNDAHCSKAKACYICELKREKIQY